MIQPHGPGERFTLLFDEEAHLPAYLPAPFRQIYSPRVTGASHSPSRATPAVQISRASPRRIAG
jgi:hypothetical protein